MYKLSLFHSTLLLDNSYKFLARHPCSISPSFHSIPIHSVRSIHIPTRYFRLCSLPVGPHRHNSRELTHLLVVVHLFFVEYLFLSSRIANVVMGIMIVVVVVMVFDGADWSVMSS